MLIIAHRGASGQEPENTLRAFQAAIDQSADGIELDVQVCASGELVVIHDASINRTTRGKGRVSKLTHSEIQKLDAGKGERIPTLKQILTLVKGQRLITIELKSRDTAKPVYELLKRSGYLGNILISSFHRSELNIMRSLDSKIPIGILALTPLRIWKTATEISAKSINLNHHAIVNNVVKKAHQRGLQVYAWTVNSPRDILRMNKLDVDAIITDFPDRARKVLNKKV